MTIATTPTGIAAIDAVAKNYAAARQAVAERVQTLEDELRIVRNRHLRGIKTAAAIAAAAQSELVAAVTAAPDLFVKPRTIVLHGIKVGYQKGKGRIEWDDEDKVVTRILDFPQRLGDREPGDFVETTHRPRKDLLLELTVGELKKLGCRVEGTGDLVVIKATDSDVDKLVAKILDEGAKDTEDGV